MTSISKLAFALATGILVTACGDGDLSGPAAATATVSGVVRAASGAVVEGASAKIGGATASWLPTRETAIDWQRMAGGTVVTSAC